MAKPKTPSQKKAYRAMRKRQALYGAQLERVFDIFTEEAAALAAVSGYSSDAGQAFHFGNYPRTASAFKESVSKLALGISFVVDRSTRAEWGYGEESADALAASVVRAYGGEVSAEEFQPYFRQHEEARDAFLAKRRDGRHGWSSRVWNLAERNGRELELAVSAAVSEGRAATRLASDIKKYLNEPDRLYRRVRDEFGNLVLSRNAEIFHPGQGVYRSSFKNALRLAASETNMAYRGAENAKWRNYDFIVGGEIHLSGSHPEEDICNMLAGKYPKEFITNWNGWHPNCLCYKTAILKTEEEFWADDDVKSKNEVAEMPEGWYKWAEENQERIERAQERGTEPWFVRDNKAAWDEAVKRVELEGATTKNGVNGAARAGRRDRKSAVAAMNENGEIWMPTPELSENADLAAAIFGIERKTPMTHEEADNWSANVNHARTGQGFQDNCPACVTAYELRRRGIDVTSLPWKEGNEVDKLGNNTWRIWSREKECAKSIAKPNEIEITQLGRNAEKFINGRMNSPGRYHIGYDFNSPEGVRGHIVVAERLKSGELIIYDPQSNDYMNTGFLASDAIRVQIVRVDNLYVRPELLQGIVRAL